MFASAARFRHSFLLFLTGQDEIEMACRVIREKMAKSSKPIRVIPFYAQQQNDMEHKDLFHIDIVSLDFRRAA